MIRNRTSGVELRQWNLFISMDRLVHLDMLMLTLLEDLRRGVRILRSTPGLTLTAIITLALGIAANTTVFGWIDGVLLVPRTLHNPERLQLWCAREQSLP